MDDDRQLRRDAAAFLERMQAGDRDRARRRLQQAPDDPDALSHYERGLLGAEWWAHVRQREAARKAAARAAALRGTVTAALCPVGFYFPTERLRQLNAHAIDLAVRHGLTVKRSPDGGGWARTIMISSPPVTTEAHYAVCLHEIGHCVAPDGDSRQHTAWIEGGHLLSAGGELGAWRWAVTHALVWTAEMQERLVDSLRHHPAYRRATTDERGRMAALLTTACLRIEDKPWTFEELETKRAAIEGANP